MRKGTIIFIIYVAIILAFIGGTVYLCTIEYQNKEVIEITVKDKYLKRAGETGDMYLVASEEGDTYKITDLFWIGKFNSTDLYNQLTIGETYRVTVTGVRIQFFSWYKNINKIEVLKEE